MARSTRRGDRGGYESEGGRAVLFVVAALALLAGAGYVAAYLGASDKVPVGTRVAGVDIGGRSPTTAEQLLREELGPRAAAPFSVTVEGRTQKVRPQAVGLGVDYVASVGRAGAERSWRPSRLWDYYTSGGVLEPVKTLDQLRLARLLSRLDGREGSSPVDGSVVFRHRSFAVNPPRPGLVVDARAAGQLFWNAYLSDSTSVLLPLASTQPTIGAVQIHRFVARFANPAVAAAVRLHLGHTELRLEPSDYAHLLGSRAVGHHLQPTVRAGALGALVDRRLGQADSADAPRDATVALLDGHPQVVPSRPGVVFAPADVGRALVRAIITPSRTARVPASLAPASYTDADARQLHIRHQITTFTVRLPRGGRVDTLMSDAAHLDNTVLKPGDTFSLRRSMASLPPGSRGDELATALFNAAWLGGLQVGDHASVGSYVGAYPVGRDATLSGGHDVSFTDDTRNGVLISVVMGRPTRSHSGSLTVSLWSSATWDVASRTSDRRNVVAAGKVVRHGKGCVERGGRDGFDVTVTRSFTRPGGSAVDHSESYVAHYPPLDAVVCKKH